MIFLGLTPKRYAPLGGAANDADAQAFITAAGITDATQQSAVNQLVLDLKSANIWTKMKAIYPIVGGSASSHAVNLKTPGTYNLTFSTGWGHASTGMTPTNAYANTFFNPLTQLTATSTHLSYYSRTATPVGSTIEIGVNNGGANYLHIRTAANFVSGANTVILAFTSTASALGFWVGSKRSYTDREVYKNGNSEATSLVNDSSAYINANMYLGAANQIGTATNYSNKECAFASIGDGLTDTESSNLYTAVQNYQTTLGRQV
jgi:hypothetical protein